MVASAGFGRTEGTRSGLSLTPLPTLRQPRCQGSVQAHEETLLVSHPNNDSGWKPGYHDAARNHMTISYTTLAANRGRGSWTPNSTSGRWSHYLIDPFFGGSSTMQDLSTGMAEGNDAVGILYIYMSEDGKDLTNLFGLPL